MALLSEIGDFRRFEHPRQLMAFVGLVPSEYSSGGKEKRGGITKTGPKQAREFAGAFDRELSKAMRRGTGGGKP